MAKDGKGKNYQELRIHNEELFKKLKIRAVMEGVSLRVLTERMVKEYLAKKSA